MERTVVNSSNLVSVGYDEDSSTLEIEFKGEQYIAISMSHRSSMNG